MLTFEHTKVFNFDGAFRGMRNPLESWNKSDSSFYKDGDCFLGKNDIALAQRLIRGGTEQRKFMRQIFICTDITAPIEWWCQFDTYKVGVTRNSCSTMHALMKHRLTPANCEVPVSAESAMYLKTINNMIQKYNESPDIGRFQQIQKAVPRGFRVKSTVTMNYENVLNMVRQREHHRLSEWNTDFMQWAHSLPYADKLIFFCDKESNNED